MNTGSVDGSVVNDLFAFTLRAMLDTMPAQFGALFLHARDDLEEPMLVEAARLWRHKRARTLVISGMHSTECRQRNIAYTGGDVWRSRLEDLGVVTTAIREIANVRNFTTGSEARQLMEMAQTTDWKSVGIMAVPYHLPRCLLTQIQAMREFHLDLDLFAVRSPEPVDWTEVIRRPLMDAANEDGERTLQASMEAERIIKYMAFPPGARVASPDEGLEYLARRDARRRSVASGG